jgi:hypothetical protein
MFNDIGYKIKKLSKVIFWGGEVITLLACWGSVVESVTSGESAGVAVAAVIGALVAAACVLVASWLLYGFGQLIDMVTLIADTRTDNVLEAFEEEYQKRQKEDDQ